MTGPLGVHMKNATADGKRARNGYIVDPKKFGPIEGLKEVSLIRIIITLMKMFKLYRTVMRLHNNLNKFRAVAIPIDQFLVESLCNHYEFEEHQFDEEKHHAIHRLDEPSATLFNCNYCYKLLFYIFYYYQAASFNLLEVELLIWHRKNVNILMA